MAPLDADAVKIEIERQKLELEVQKFKHIAEYDEKKFRSEKAKKFWSQIATLIPILAIIIGFYSNVRLESIKQVNASSVASIKQKKDFIDRQLAHFYYPIKLRLEKDTAVWKLSGQLSPKNRAKTDEEFSKYIENSVLIPNHEEIIKL